MLQEVRVAYLEKTKSLQRQLNQQCDLLYNSVDDNTAKHIRKGACKTINSLKKNVRRRESKKKK